MLDTNFNNLFQPSQRDHQAPIVRTHVYSNTQTSSIQLITPSIQSQVSRDLQNIFHHTLITPSPDSSSPAIDQKTITLNNDFGLLVGEVHALFKVIYNQGIAIQPDLQKMDRFEQRLDELNLQLEDLAQTKDERKQAETEINDVREAVRQIRLLAKQLETYHPLSLAFGKSEAKFVDQYTNSNHPGSALLATRELATMIRDFSSLGRNALDPSREKPIDDRIQELYEQELEELGDVIKDWAEHLNSQIQEEIQELARCLTSAKEEDREPLLRQVIALDRQLASVKGQIRNYKLPDPSLKPLIQDCVSDINRRQRELQKLISAQETRDYEQLDYGSEDWTSLVEKRPKEPVGWISSTLTVLGNPSQWNSTVKTVVKTVFNLKMLYDNVSQISNEIQSRSPQIPKESPAFKAEHFPKNPNAVSLQQKSEFSTSMEQAGVENNLNFIFQAPTAVQSVPIESNLRQKYETLNSTAMSLKKTYDFLVLVQVPPEQRPEFSGSVSKLYQEAVNLANNTPYTQSLLERADWMQAVDDLSYAKTVLENEMMQKAIETGNQGLLKALLNSGLDPNGKGEDGIPFLKSAVILSDKAIVQLLTDAGGDLAHFIDEVFEQHDIESLAGMVKIGHKLSPDKVITEDLLKACESAIKNNQIEDVKNIISAMGINSQNANNETPLMKAAEHNLLELVKILISFPDIDLNKGAAYNDTPTPFPLITAIFYGNTEIVRLFATDSRIDINKGTFVTSPLLTAIDRGNKEIVSLLLAHPQINIKKRIPFGKDLFTRAVHTGNLELVKLFMADSQFDLNKALYRHGGDMTALHLAIEGGHQEVVDEIKRTGKDTISEDIRRIKEFSHSWELKGYMTFGDLRIDLEGFQQRVFAPFVSSSLNEFKRKYPASLPDEQVQMISEALNRLMSVAPKQALQDFKAGKPVFIPTGFEHHAIVVMIYGSNLIIGNKGPYSLRPIEAYQIDSDQVTEEFFKKLLDCQELRPDDEFGFEKLFRVQNDRDGPLLQQLRAKSDEISLWLESLHHTTREQTVGNCAWESLETAMYGLMALDSALKIIKDPANPPFEKELLAQKTYETFSKLEKFTRLQSVIQALGAIEERLLMPSTKKESMIEGANLIKSSYSRDDMKDFWDQRNVIEIKFGNILHLIEDETEMSGLEQNIFKTQKHFDSMVFESAKEGEAQ